VTSRSKWCVSPPSVFPFFPGETMPPTLCGQASHGPRFIWVFCFRPSSRSSLIEQPEVIEKILTHLGIWPTQAHSPPVHSIAASSVRHGSLGIGCHADILLRLGDGPVLICGRAEASHPSCLWTAASWVPATHQQFRGRVGRPAAA